MSEDVAGPRPRIPAWVWDAAGALLVLGAALPAFREPASLRTPVGWAAVLLPAAILLLRRRFPWSVLIACTLCFGVAMFTFPLVPGESLAVSIAIYTVTVRSRRRDALWAALATAVALLICVAVAREDVLGPGVLLVIVSIGFAGALGDAVRTRRAYIEEIMQRAVRAEATREAEASRRVAEDRLRIARDLHDTVAHQISVISLNAGLAASALEERPEVTRAALVTIRGAARTVLGEIGDLLSTLRMPDEGVSGRSTVGLADLEAMLEGFRSSGLDVTAHLEGPLGELPPSADVVAYRVVQEALTNALKHGVRRQADLRIGRDDDGLHLVVANPAGEPDAEATGGHGIIGIRERVDSVRGRVRTSHGGGRHVLEVDIPLASDRRRIA